MAGMILQDKVVVVTGGNGGIGAAVVDRALEEGARVFVWDLAEARPRPGMTFVTCDVTSEKAVEDALATTLAEAGKIDVLVNSVGITGKTDKVTDYSLAEWERVMRINLTSAFLCSRAVANAMLERNAGRIVNISSIAGKEGNPNQSAYSASKAAMIALTKSMGKELAETGIRVNCVTPAIIATDLIYQMTEEQRALVLSKIPMKRPGQPAEVAELVLWLSSDACSFSTGATFDISGGRATY